MDCSTKKTETEWHNAKLDGLPCNNQQVLISVDGIYYDAIFYGDKNKFITSSNPKRAFQAEEKLLYWRDQAQEN
jgi:hypothetical protein